MKNEKLCCTCSDNTFTAFIVNDENTCSQLQVAPNINKVLHGISI